MIRGALLIASAIALVCVVRTAHADVPRSGINVEGAPTAERGSDWYVSDSLDFRGALRPAVGLLGDWSYGALTLRDARGKPSTELLTDRMILRVAGTLVVADRFRFGASLPMTVFDNPGEPRPRQLREPSAPAFGDLRLSTSARLVGAFGDPATLAIGLRAYLPTGSKDDSTSDGTLRMEPQLLFAGRHEAIVYAASLGVQIRPRRAAFAGRELGSEASFSAAIGVKVNDRVVLGPEIFGSTVIDGADAWFATRATPIEILLGGHLRVRDDVTVGTSIGRRLTGADLAPSMRVLVLLDYAPDYCVDRDGDGICATVDACPEADGPRSSDPRSSGCPLDSDGDGVLDREDVCPHTPGSRSVAPEMRGCPERAPETPR